MGILSALRRRFSREFALCLLDNGGVEEKQGKEKGILKT